VANKTLILPETYVQILQEPWGEVLKEIPQNNQWCKNSSCWRCDGAKVQPAKNRTVSINYDFLFIGKLNSTNFQN